MRFAVMIVAGMIAGGCTAKQSSTASTGDVVFLTREGCVNTTTMKANLDEALRLSGQPSQFQVIDLDTLPDGDVRRGYPTPTVLVANRDLFGMAEPKPPYPTPT